MRTQVQGRTGENREPISHAVILVGGGGTRLRPLTESIAKPLIPVLNRPLVTLLIEQLQNAGVEDIVLAASAADKSIEARLGDGSDLGVRLSYSYETEALGSGLAVRQAAQSFDSSFFVCNGDIASDFDLSAMAAGHQQQDAILSICLKEVEDPSGFGVAVVDGSSRITRFVEKPPVAEAPSRLANAGIWIFEPGLLDFIPDRKQDGSLERNTFPCLIDEGFTVYGHIDNGYWLDVGTPERYLQLHRDLLGNNGLVLGKGCHVDAKARVEGASVLGDWCSLEAGSKVVDSVIWDGVHIGSGSKVRDTIIGSGCVIGEGVTLTGAVLASGVTIADRAVVPEGARISRYDNSTLGLTA